MKDPNKIYSKFNIDKTTDSIRDKKINLDMYETKSGKSGILSTNSLVESTEELADVVT